MAKNSPKSKSRIEGKDEGFKSMETVQTTLQDKQLMKFVLKSDKHLFLGLLIFRLVNAWIIETSFVPDEYWQSVEVAHNMVFGYGYLTWEWREGLRSYLYPFCFSCYFYILKLCCLDYIILITKGPRMLQATLAALGDLFTYKMSLKLTSNHKAAQWTLICQMTSCYLFYTSTRTLTNSTEASLISIALYFFPWHANSKKDSLLSISTFVTIACLSTIMRPTSLVIWLPLILWQLKLSLERNMLWKTIKIWLIIGLSSLVLSSIIDYHFYGRWTNVYYNFLKFNVLSNMSDTYGTHPWHWYVSQGFPVVYYSHTIIFLIALSKKSQTLFLFITAWTVLIYSCLSHKEFRFLSGTLPFVMHICGVTLFGLLETDASLTKRTDEDHKDSQRHPTIHKKYENKSARNKKPTEQRNSKLKIFVFISLICLNFPPAFYTCLVHQRGSVDVMKYISRQAITNANISVLFLLPCHSTPYYSYVHENIKMQFLTCEPNLNHLHNYFDEADEFFSAPKLWLSRQNWPTSTPVSSAKDVIYDITPSHIVMFESLFKELGPFLSRFGFQNSCATFFHTNFPQGRISSHLVVTCR